MATVSFLGLVPLGLVDMVRRRSRVQAREVGRVEGYVRAAVEQRCNAARRGARTLEASMVAGIKRML